MIFKSLFKKKNNKKWQSEKISERLAAITELSVDISEQKNALHELAFNDESTNVRLQALLKLNDFGLYWQAYKQDTDSQLVKRAKSALKDQLLSMTETGVSASDKQLFIEQSASPSLLEEWMPDIVASGNEALLGNALTKASKPALYTAIIQNSDVSLTFRMNLLSAVADIDVLRKLFKKTNGELKARIGVMVEEHEYAKNKPKTIESNARLVLAKLKAQRDIQNYEMLVTQVEGLQAEWHSLQQEFDTLSNVVLTELTDKYNVINGLVSHHMLSLKTDWQAEQDKHQQAILKQELSQQLTSELDSVSARIIALLSSQEGELTTKTSSSTSIDSAKTELLSRLQEVDDRVQVSILTPLEQKGFVARIKQLCDSANNFENDLLARREAEDELATLSTLAEVVVESSSSLNAEQAEEYRLSKARLTALMANPVINASLNDEFISKAKVLEPFFKAYNKNQSKQLGFIRAKSQDIENLIKQGRFNQVFGSFKKVEAAYEQLSDYNQAQIERRWALLHSQVAKLSDLQQSVTAPKVAELTEVAQQLAESPIADPTEQAHRVQTLRKNWNALRLDETKHQNDIALFNEYSEQAFAPCREYYQTLEQERKDNLTAKTTLLEQLDTLYQKLTTEPSIRWKDVEMLFSKLQKTWATIGQIDKSKVKQVNDRYYKRLRDIKSLIFAEHQANKEHKQRLVAKATQLASDENIGLLDKTAELKTIQKEWKAFGFAGGKVDKKLWTEFRKVNDHVFGQLSEQKQSDDKASSVAKTDIIEQLNTYKDAVSITTDTVKLKQAMAECEAILVDDQRVQDLSKSDLLKVNKVKASIVADLQVTLTNAVHARGAKQYNTLFSICEQVAKGEISIAKALEEATPSLKKHWHQALLATTSGQPSHDVARQITTLKLEIICGRSVSVSNNNEAKQRQHVQMEMMSQKLADGADFDKEALLVEWLQAGAWQPTDVEYIKRVQLLFNE